MHKNFKILFLTLALLPLRAFGQPPHIEILETDPAAGVALNSNDPLYVRVKYQSDEPLRFRITGFLHAAKMDNSASFNPAPEYPAGAGEAIAWIAYSEKTDIDELKLIVSDGSWQTIDKLSLPMEISWSGETARTRRQPAKWVHALNTQQQAMASNSMGQLASAGDSAFWGLLLMLLAWSIPGYLALQIYMLVKYQDRWRKLAMLPLWGSVPLFVYTLFALMAGSNLWPLMLLFLAPFGLIYLLIVWWMKRAASE